MSEAQTPQSGQHATPQSDTAPHDHIPLPPQAVHPDPEKEAVLDPDRRPCLVQTVLDNESESVLPVLDKWNEPKVNRLRYLATVAEMVIMGLHDAATGALIPYVRHSISLIVNA
jgi:hypothetical protein